MGRSRWRRRPVAPINPVKWVPRSERSRHDFRTRRPRPAPGRYGPPRRGPARLGRPPGPPGYRPGRRPRAGPRTGLRRVGPPGRRRGRGGRPARRAPGPAGVGPGSFAEALGGACRGPTGPAAAPAPAPSTSAGRSAAGPCPARSSRPATRTDPLAGNLGQPTTRVRFGTAATCDYGPAPASGSRPAGRPAGSAARSASCGWTPASHLRGPVGPRRGAGPVRPGVQPGHRAGGVDRGVRPGVRAWPGRLAAHGRSEPAGGRPTRGGRRPRVGRGHPPGGLRYLDLKESLGLRTSTTDLFVWDRRRTGWTCSRPPTGSTGARSGAGDGLLAAGGSAGCPPGWPWGPPARRSSRRGRRSRPGTRPSRHGIFPGGDLHPAVQHRPPVGLAVLPSGR